MTYTKIPPKVKSSSLSGYHQVCTRHHVNAMELLAQEELSNTVLRSEDIMICYDRFASLLNRSADAADHPLFGFELATHQGLKTYGPLGLLASQSATVGESLDVIQKYFHFHAQGVSISFSEQERNMHLGVKIQIDPGICQIQLMEMSLLQGYNVLNQLSPDLASCTRIHFKHEPLAPLEEYQKYTRARISFGTDKNELIFPAHILRQKPSAASEEVKHYLENFLSRESEGKEQPLKLKVSKLIYELIPTGEASLTTIAPMLGMNVRTLQRELRLDGTEFRALLDEVRFEIARTYLDQHYSITDVALNLGYSELSAFSRAFKRWSGITPQQWRSQTFRLAG
ncbi:AraC family transcriptional regulator [Neptuniibacter halophilus]|uniref:AraC family transcriptional regulator n=1 Tax=Neptuniibacter halophilus TaxID=651666 RepID=UPI0025737BA2|nr:AraC family transcriptional regulator [Neptuniibacter halophilus]